MPEIQETDLDVTDPPAASEPFSPFEQNPLFLSALNREGLFYNLKISTWSARTKVDPQELGLPEDINKELLRLGSKILLTKDYTGAIQNVREQAYSALREMSQPFFESRFVPADMVADLERVLEELRNEFWQKVDELIAVYDDAKDTMYDSWVAEVSKIFGDEEARGNALRMIRSAYPDAVGLRLKYSFEWVSYAISLPDTNIAASVSDARQVQETSAAIRRATERTISQIQTMAEDQAREIEQMIVDLCQSVIETSDASSSGLHQKTVNRISKQIERIKRLNYMDLQSVNNAVATLEEVASTPAKEIRSSGNIDAFREAIRSVQIETQQALDSDKSEQIRGFIATQRRAIEAPF